MLGRSLALSWATGSPPKTLLERGGDDVDDDDDDDGDDDDDASRCPLCFTLAPSRPWPELVLTSDAPDADGNVACWQCGSDGPGEVLLARFRCMPQVVSNKYHMRDVICMLQVVPTTLSRPLRGNFGASWGLV